MDLDALQSVKKQCPNLGFGVGLRTVHYSDFLGGHPEVDWLEAITENYLGTGGRPRQVLRQLAARYPIVLHGVSLSIGGSSPLDRDYLTLLRDLAQEVQACWISDHLCWTGYAHHNLHDLLPMPLTEASLAHVIRRVDEVQNFLGRAILLENPSSYASFTVDCIAEAQFLREVALSSGCGLLLDVNNVYVSSINHGLDAKAYIDTIPREAVGQYHLAGHSKRDGYLLDSHIGPVPEPVWELFRYTLSKVGPRSTLLEWDEEIPDLDVLLRETATAKAMLPRTPLRQAIVPELRV
ncbi:MAG: DUF692 domain-containing protein [Bdellovibrionales bacterium]|nr:DUF692 domain-containing protein [Bdellovibrionales bacterium]